MWYMTEDNTNVNVRRSRKQMRQERRKRHIRSYAIKGATLLAFGGFLAIGMTSSFAYAHKTVELNVDGKTITAGTFSDTVSDVLKEQGVELKAHDSVSPAKTTKLSSGLKIQVNSAKEVAVNVDGKDKEVWTTASSANEIANEFSKDNKAVTVAARSPFRDGTKSEVVDKSATINVVHDGVVDTVEAKNNEKAEDILKKIGVEPSPIDKVKLSNENNQTTIIVQRVERTYENKVEEIPFEVTIEKDPELAAGERKVTQEGKNGEKEISTYYEKIDGNVVHQGNVNEKVNAEPVNEVVHLGVKGIDASKLPDDQEELKKLTKTDIIAKGTSVPDVSTAYTGEDPRALAAPLVAAKGWSDDDYKCLVALWEKESHWNPNAYNASSGATGIPQALPGNKMASAGEDWRTNPVTQIRWGLGYISGRYGTPCGAWSHSQAKGWY